jgi:hypothetical protein
MFWMEFLRVRTGASAENDFRMRADKFDAEAGKLDALVAWDVHRHATIRGDFSILIQCDSPQIQRDGSPLARRLAEDMSLVGVVDHSVWTLYPTILGCTRTPKKGRSHETSPGGIRKPAPRRKHL